MQLTLSRRLSLGLTALAATSPPKVLRLPAASAAQGIPREELLRKLSRVPLFIITNQEDAPYLTEVDTQARRSGYFFLGPQEAVAALNDVREFDPKASLSVISLDAVWFDVAKSAAEAAAAPQPKAGTSTDLKLFRVRPLQDAAALADRERLPDSSILTKDKKLSPDDIPLYYDPSFTLTING